MEDCAEDSMVCIKLEASRLWKRDKMGMPMSIPEEASAIDFHRMDNSLDRREALHLFFLFRCKLLPILL